MPINEITKKSVGYDAEFEIEIKALRPDWFVSRFDMADKKKEQLLEMARNRESRPLIGKHPLGTAFWEYTHKHGGKKASYDAEFEKKVKALRPDWLK